jgi:hypothetical protein
VPDRPDLIALPEVSELCEAAQMEPLVESCPRHDAQLLEYFSGVARSRETWLALPTLRPAENGRVYNSIRLLDRRGQVHGTYDKNHLTIGEIEAGIASSDRAEVIETEFGRVAGVICFDLNFEPLLQKYAPQKPDLVLFCSMYHGGLMQQIWAYRCRAHMVAAISGVPGGILSPIGEQLANVTNYTNHVTQRINLDCCVAHFDYHFEKLAALKHKYGPDVVIHDPGKLGSVLITSRSQRATVRQMVEEFEIELLDAYFARAMGVREQELRNLNPV